MKKSYQKMLVPMDGSKLAESVIPYAAELAGVIGLELILFHVCDADDANVIKLHQGYSAQIAERLQHDADEIRKHIRPESRRKTATLKTAMATGSTADSILRYAQRHRISLILMATHGRTGIARWALGSVADRVTRSSKVPVLLIRAGLPYKAEPDKIPEKRILIPLDGSKLAESVLPHVEMLAGQYGKRRSRIVLIRVFKPPLVPRDYPTSVSGNWDKLMRTEIKNAKNEAQEYLDSVKSQLASQGFTVQTAALTGDVAETIIDYANANALNLIAMATHGHSGINRWAFGSVAGKVMQGASCPILLVHSRYADIH